ncbi:MAG: adenylate/guanylate cyclase domain-containing protein [Candidatus Dormibacteraceae bacterium]
MDFPPDIRYAVYDSKSIAFQKFGRGDRRVVQINSAAGHLDLVWTDAAVSDALIRLSEVAEIVMFEPLGQGLSDPVTHVVTLEEHAAVIGAVMDAAGFESATISAVLHTSLAVFAFAAQHPERVEGLVLCSPLAQGWRSAPFAELVGWQDAGEVEAHDRRWQGVLECWGEGESLRLFAPMLATRRNTRLWGVLERASASPAMVRTMFEAAVTSDIRHALPLVQAPTLVLRPAGNESVPEAVVRDVADQVPGATYRELPATESMAQFWANYTQQIEQFLFGVTRSEIADRALMTVLFTDIVGSTERATVLGDTRWREVLVAHERMLRDRLASAGGRLVKLTGDGSLCVFDGPARAIRCAEQICAAAAGLDLEIRAGLHTGECEVIESDVAGVAVHIAARVSALAGSGEVLVSRTIRDLVAGSGIRLYSRGEHELKGVAGAWEIFAVGEETAPLIAPEQRRDLRVTDRLALFAARRNPSLLRAASRIQTPRLRG